MKNIIKKLKKFSYLIILKFSLGIIFSISFKGAGKSILFNKKIIPKIKIRANPDFTTIPKKVALELVFFKLHITLVNFKLRHICVFSIKNL